MTQTIQYVKKNDLKPPPLKWCQNKRHFVILSLYSIDFFFLQLITEQASFTLPRSAEIEGKCASSESEIHITWKNKAYSLRIFFSKVAERTWENDVTNKPESRPESQFFTSLNSMTPTFFWHFHSGIYCRPVWPPRSGRVPVTPLCGSVLQEFRDKGTEVWKISKVQFIYDTSETSHFINAYNRECPAEPLYSRWAAQFLQPDYLWLITTKIIVTWWLHGENNEKSGVCPAPNSHQSHFHTRNLLQLCRPVKMSP